MTVILNPVKVTTLVGGRKALRNSDNLKLVNSWKHAAVNLVLRVAGWKVRPTDDTL